MFKFILNKKLMEDTDETIFEATENSDGLTTNISWEDEYGCVTDVDYRTSQVDDNINTKIWLIVK